MDLGMQNWGKRTSYRQVSMLGGSGTVSRITRFPHASREARYIHSAIDDEY